MEFTKMTEDVSQVSKLGNHPKSDNGLTAAGLKAWFDKAGEITKSFLNNTLLPELETRFTTLETWAKIVDSKIDDFVAGSGFLPTTGGTMSGDINMGNRKVTNLASPTADADGANKAFVDSSIEKANEEVMVEVETLVSEAKTYADSKYYSVAATLVAESWVGKVQSVTVSGVVADEAKVDVYASPTSEASNYEVYAECGVRVLGQGANTVIFTCEDVPADDLTVNIAVVIKGSPVIGGEYEDGDGIAYG